jgi:hypothetical protein
MDGENANGIADLNQDVKAYCFYKNVTKVVYFTRRT